MNHYVTSNNRLKNTLPLSKGRINKGSETFTWKSHFKRKFRHFYTKYLNLNYFVITWQFWQIGCLQKRKNYTEPILHLKIKKKTGKLSPNCVFHFRSSDMNWSRTFCMVWRNSDSLGDVMEWLTSVLMVLVILKRKKRTFWLVKKTKSACDCFSASRDQLSSVLTCAITRWKIISYLCQEHIIPRSYHWVRLEVRGKSNKATLTS